ncbi:divisome protein SepX/GlpR [Mycolicibacterium gadium]|uniref:Membrane protein n=1 Tax=Mycolicibacterium gadium TaxID=1794 RepID=A0A7I7WMM4_MYCGU|nr:gephyrin-like molybdotransferase receptor GlpR [Mycolicibacterium gadium]BBZ18919.1 membrane protein [Mycolicibacterium gadium]
MPSIPQSLLWISLVVLWLFVLVPMLISKRDAVRRTSDVALATRVLNDSRARLLRRKAPAAGHASDPDWRPSEEDLDDDLDEDRDDEAEEAPARRTVVRVAAVDEKDEDPGYLDVDVIDEDATALPAGESARAETDELTLDFDDVAEAEPVAEEAGEPQAEREPEGGPEADGTDDEYEYVADSAGLEAPSDNELELADSLSAARKRRYESKTAAAVSARKYKFRKRMLTVMAVLVIAAVVSAYTVSSTMWWVSAAVSAVTLFYLGYLRRQTRIEERLRRRRAQRMARSRLGVENTDDREFDVVPSRLRRPGAVVLEIDDEDPAFEHLDYAPFARHFDLPRAAGQ